MSLEEDTHPQDSGSRGMHYLRFWTRYFERVRALHPTWVGKRNPIPRSWVGQSSGTPGTYISVCFGRGGKLRHELYIDTGGAAENEALFEDLRRHREELETAYGRPLDFQRLPGKRGCRIADHTAGDVMDEDHWNEFIAWFLDAGARLRRALAETRFSGA
jgi:hypothetical protein